MSRDIRIPVMVDAETYVAWHFICEEKGASMSGECNTLIKREISEYAHRAAAHTDAGSAKEAQR